MGKQKSNPGVITGFPTVFRYFIVEDRFT